MDTLTYIAIGVIYWQVCLIKYYLEGNERHVSTELFLGIVTLIMWPVIMVLDIIAYFLGLFGVRL